VATVTHSSASDAGPMQKEIIMRTRSRKLALAALAAPIGAAALIATACSSSSHTSSPGSSSSATGPAASASSMTVKTQTGPLGSSLTDASGGGVPLSPSDTRSTSGCWGACPPWGPPLPAKGPVSGRDGASSTDITTITRQDGTKQVTYAGHPLYYFAGDNGA